MIKSPEREELRQLLIKGWMTHDAMWFRHCVEACGIETANRVNQAAVRSMAAVEIRRLTKALGIAEVRSMDALRELIEGAWQIVKADFMDFACTFPAPDVMRWEVRRCFAFEGVTQIGVADRYECGIFPRIEAWLDTLGIAYTVTPTAEGCLMAADRPCVREYRFAFGAPTR
jgi:hypothetical protein